MTDTIAQPVQGVINALHRGTVLTKRICRTVANAPAAQKRNIEEPVLALETALIFCKTCVEEAYAESRKALGRRFADAIINDAGATNRFQSQTINISHQLNTLDEYIDDPDSFDLGSFGYIKRESERCSKQAVDTLVLVHQALLQADAQRIRPGTSDDRTQLSSQQIPVASPPRANDGFSSSPSTSVNGLAPATSRPTITRKQVPALALDHRPAEYGYGDGSNGANSTTSVLSVVPESNTTRAYPGPPVPPKSPWSTTLPSCEVPNTDPNVQSQAPVFTSTFYRAYKDPKQLPLPTPNLNATAANQVYPINDVSSTPTEDALIRSEEIERQRKVNEDFLEKRKRNRQSFNHDMQQLRSESRSTGPNSKDLKLHQLNDSVLAGEAFVASPLERHDSGDAERFHSDRDPRNITTTTGSRSSMASESASVVRSNMQRQDSGEPMIFGSPESPPLSNRGSVSGPPGWNFRPRTPNSSGFGEGVPDGIQVAGQNLVSDPGLIPLYDEQVLLPATPAISIYAAEQATADQVIGSDASFYKYGGFCDGAKQLLAGEDPLKVVKKPGGIGYSERISKKCTKCSYEIGFEAWELDKALDPNAIYSVPGAPGVRFRNRFLSKSHVIAKHTVEIAYACLFCIEEGKTVDNHDATIFFTGTQLLLHVSKHARPLPEIPGVKLIYGESFKNDIDICFRDPVPLPNPFLADDVKFRSRPTARAISNHRTYAKGFRERDPNGQKTMQFAAGARIFGVTYPPRYDGFWCCGYHDNTRAFFPASMIQLEAPTSEKSLKPSPRSTVSALAKWDHRPPSHLAVTWLSFKAKETIKNISYSSEDSWCWMGMNSKGKYGIFPSCFVEKKPDAGERRRSTIAEVGSKVSKALQAGAEDRWSGSPSAGVGMWAVMTTASMHPVNTPRPVSVHSVRRNTGASDSPSLQIGSLDEGAALSPPNASAESRERHGSLFGRLTLGRSRTNASRSGSLASVEAMSP